TLGSAHAWLERGGAPHREGVVVQECGIGLVELRHDETGLAFRAPELLRSGAVAESVVADVLAAVRLDRSWLVDSTWVDNGPGWLGLRLRSAADVLAAVLTPDLGEHKVGLIGPHPAGGPADFEVRAFAGSLGVGEDPVTGSLNAGFAR